MVGRHGGVMAKLQEMAPSGFVSAHCVALASFPDLTASFGTRSEAEGLVSQVI